MRSILLIMWAVLALTSPVFAQSIDMTGGQNGEPLTIDAVGGIEWDQQKKMFTAAGPAKATRGVMVLDADELRAYYRDTKDGKSEIFRLDAIGNVTITTPGRVATGGKAIYDVDKSVIVLKDGNPVKMVSGNDVITAKDQLEFWDNRNLAVARGQATAVHLDKHLYADVLTAHFIKQANGKTQVGRIEAFDHVRIDTANEQVFSDRGAYNVPTGLARLTGSVKIKRGANILKGCSADIDLNTGISRLNKCADSALNGVKPNLQNPPTGRVHGVLSPKGKK